MTEYNSPGPKLKKWQSTMLVRMSASTMKARKIFSFVRRLHKSRIVWKRWKAYARSATMPPDAISCR